jgi:UDP-N-acetylglucosamine 2-epimerase
MKTVFISIVGARPQFIKAAAVSRAIAEHNRKFPEYPIAEKTIHTGQHYDGLMSGVFFEQLEIRKPDYNLCVGSGTHGKQTARMLEEIERILITEAPAFIIVYGDTNSTLSGALAAAKLQIPIAHVEAGLRSFNRRMPEEVNRVLTDHVSDILLCPTETAVANLTSEGISEGVYLAGDVMYDSLCLYAKKAKAIEHKTLKQLGLESKSYYLATVHRAENTDDGNCLQDIFDALDKISSTKYPVVLSLHPRTRQKISEGNVVAGESIRIIPPVPYLEMMTLETNARAILTDSGGVQKEAYWLKVPCITLRNETEWSETVDSGWNVLAGPNYKRIVQAVEQAESHPNRYENLIYGNGHCAKQICRILLKSFAGYQQMTAERETIPG